MYDFVIVGAGAHGCAAAYHLARRGASVAVVDARTIASGASGGRGKRGVRANRRDLRELALMRQAYDMWPSLDEELDCDVGYARTGGVQLIQDSSAGSTSGMAAARTLADIQSRLGIPTELWPTHELRDRLPAASLRIKAALYAPLDGVASQEATTRAYAAAAQRHGAVFIEGTAVTDIATDGAGRARGVRTSQDTQIEAARSVILTNNLGATDLVRAAVGFTVPIWPILPQAVFLKSERTPQIPYLTSHDSRALSVKILEDDVIMLSGGWRGRWNPETQAGEVVQERVDANVDQLRAVFPCLGLLDVIAADASRPESAAIDGIPFIDIVPGTSNLVAATGWTGHGWALVPSVATNVAEWLLTGRKPAVLESFGFSRALPTKAGHHAP